MQSVRSNLGIQRLISAIIRLFIRGTHTHSQKPRVICRETRVKPGRGAPRNAFKPETPPNFAAPGLTRLRAVCNCDHDNSDNNNAAAPTPALVVYYSNLVRTAGLVSSSSPRYDTRVNGKLLIKKTRKKKFHFYSVARAGFLNPRVTQTFRIGIFN